MNTASLPKAAGSANFTTAKAQRWILTAALVTGLIYALRRGLEPITGQAATTTKRGQLAGAGPPPPFTHWIAGYGTAFIFLAVLSLGAPEIAGAMAILELIATILINGTTLAADLQGLQHHPLSPLTSTATASAAATAPAAHTKTSIDTIAQAPLHTNG